MSSYLCFDPNSNLTSLMQNNTQTLHTHVYFFICFIKWHIFLSKTKTKVWTSNIAIMGTPKKVFKLVNIRGGKKEYLRTKCQSVRYIAPLFFNSGLYRFTHIQIHQWHPLSESCVREKKAHMKPSWSKSHAPFDSIK